jgi:hypothetical protein
MTINHRVPTATNVHHVIMNTAYQPPNGTRVTDHRHASDGGCTYPKEMLEQAIAMYLQGGLDALKTPMIQQLRANHKFPHIDTCKRWITCITQRVMSFLSVTLGMLSLSVK